MIDGRRINVFYFSDELISKNNFLLWYAELIEKMNGDNIEPTHLGLLSKFTPNAYYRLIKRVQKRYLGIIDADYESVKDLSIISVQPEGDAKMPAIMYGLEAGLHIERASGINSSSKWCAHFTVDYSILPCIDIEKYTDIFRKYVPWKEEHYFENGKDFVNINYLQLRKKENYLKQHLESGDIWNIRIVKNYK